MKVTIIFEANEPQLLLECENYAELEKIVLALINAKIKYRHYIPHNFPHTPESNYKKYYEVYNNQTLYLDLTALQGHTEFVEKDFWKI